MQLLCKLIRYLNIRFYKIPQMSNKFKYNPFRIPSSLTTAQEHRAATSAGTPISREQLCGCCLLPVNQSSLPINFDVCALSDFGNQYRSLYDYTKIVGIILVLILFDSGISQFQDTIILAEQNISVNNLNWSSLSPSYPHSKFWLYSCLSFVALTIFLLVARIIQTYRLNNMFGSKQGLEDWSVLLKNIPKGPNVEENIRDLFKTNFNQIRIKQIILLPNMQKYEQTESQIIKQVESWRQLLKNEQKKKQEILQSLKAIDAANTKLSKVKQQLLANKNDNFSGNSIVVFERREDQQQVLKAWKSKFFTKNKLGAAFGELGLSEKEFVLVEGAPSPSQIDWKNICLPNTLQQSKIRMNYIFFFLLQVLVFLFYFTSQLVIGRRIGQKPEQNKGTIPTLALLSVISYYLLPYLLELLQTKQRNLSMTQKYTQLTKKITICFILVRTLIIFVTESVFVEGSQLAVMALDKVVLFSFCDLIISMIFWILNPHDLIKRAFKILATKRNKLTQSELNTLFERPSHNLPLKYGFMISSFWTAICYSNLAPIVIPVQSLGLLVFYWIDKLNLARRSSINNKNISNNYILMIHELIQISLILKPLANLILWSVSNQSIAIPEIVMLIFGIFCNQAPKQRLVQWILSTVKQPCKQIQYTYNENNFDSLYDIESPITGSLQLKMRWMQTKHGIKLQINNQNSQITDKFNMDDKINVENIANDNANQGEAAGEQRKLQDEDKQTDRNMFSAPSD